jgi:hypothetical protein
MIGGCEKLTFKILQFLCCNPLWTPDHWPREYLSGTGGGGGACRARCGILLGCGLLVTDTGSKHQAFRVSCSERVTVRMLSGWVVVTRHLPRNLALAHLSHSYQRSSPGLWTVVVHMSLLMPCPCLCFTRKHRANYRQYICLPIKQCSWCSPYIIVNIRPLSGMWSAIFGVYLGRRRLCESYTPRRSAI